MIRRRTTAGPATSRLSPPGWSTRSARGRTSGRIAGAAPWIKCQPASSADFERNRCCTWRHDDKRRDTRREAGRMVRCADGRGRGTPGAGTAVRTRCGIRWIHSPPARWVLHADGAGAQVGHGGDVFMLNHPVPQDCSRHRLPVRLRAFLTRPGRFRTSRRWRCPARHTRSPNLLSVEVARPVGAGRSVNAGPTGCPPSRWPARWRGSNHGDRSAPRHSCGTGATVWADFGRVDVAIEVARR